MTIDVTWTRLIKDRSRIKSHDQSTSKEARVRFKNNKPTKFCADPAVVEQYLIELRSIIDRFQINATVHEKTAWETEMGYFLAYVKKDENVAKIKGGECDKFMKGLMDAKKMDREAQKQRHEAVMQMRESLHEAVRKVNGGKDFEEL